MWRMIRGLLVLAVLALGAVPATAQEPTGERVALVIGNAAYEHAQRLVNPLNDAEAIAAKLDDLGFAVTRAENLGLSDFPSVIAAFEERAEAAELAVVYYSGHGLQHPRTGESLLMPVDTDLDSESDLNWQIRLDTLVAAAKRATAAIVIIDACRDNPFRERLASGTKSLGGVPRGLGRDAARLAEQDSRVLIAYAAEPGAVAYDGAGASNSPYAEALLENLDRPISVRRLFGAVREQVTRRVREASDGDWNQEPVYWDGLGDIEISFAPAADLPPEGDDDTDEPSEQDLAQAMRRCDELAAAPFDETSDVLTSVPNSQLSEAALDACSLAVESPEAEARHYFQLARSKLHTTGGAQAVDEYLRQAMRRDPEYRAAQHLLGRLWLILGAGWEPFATDELGLQQATDHLVDAAEAGHAPAMYEVGALLAKCRGLYVSFRAQRWDYEYLYRDEINDISRLCESYDHDGESAALSAYRYLAKAAELKEPRAMHLVALLSLSAYVADVNPDFFPIEGNRDFADRYSDLLSTDEAFQELVEAADIGDEHSEMAIAYILAFSIHEPMMGMWGKREQDLFYKRLENIKNMLFEYIIRKEEEDHVAPVPELPPYSFIRRYVEAAARKNSYREKYEFYRREGDSYLDLFLYQCLANPQNGRSWAESGLPHVCEAVCFADYEEDKLVFDQRIDWDEIYEPAQHWMRDRFASPSACHPDRWEEELNTVTRYIADGLSDHFGLLIRESNIVQPITHSLGDLMTHEVNETKMNVFPIAYYTDLQYEGSHRAWPFSNTMRLSIIHEWQDLNGYTATGFLTQEQIARLLREFDALLVQHLVPARFREPPQEVRGGDRGRIYLAQRALRARDHDVGPLDGVMGPNTRAAIRAWQTEEDFPTTGSLTDGQWRRLVTSVIPTMEPVRREPFQTIHACDRLAAHPYDRRAVAEGVDFEAIDVPAALEACRAARDAYPDVARFVYQYGRVLHAGDRDEEAVGVYREAAEAGYPRAMTSLGNMLDAGEGVEEDDRAAVLYWRQAATLDDPGGMKRLGDAFWFGTGGIEENAHAAADWYRQAARLDNDWAMVALGDLHYDGELDGEPDYETAMDWYRRAAELGNATATNAVGWQYEDGLGVEEDADEALRWYRRAADRGSIQALENIARFYATGTAVEKNPTLALEYYRTAAAEGDASAALALAELRLEGEGVERDVLTAIDWLDRALEIAPDYDEAREELARLCDEGHQAAC